MTEIQQTNIVVANLILSELHKEMPFDLELDAGQTGSLHEIAMASQHLHSGFVSWVEQVTKSRVINGTGIIIRVQEHFSDSFYHMLSTYTQKYEVRNLSGV